LRTAIRWGLHHPRGPRSGPGYSVPVRHHLIGPIRPTRGHIAISPHGGLYAMPSLLRERLGDPRAVPGFRCTFRSDMPPSTTPGSSNIDKFQSSDVDIGLRRVLSGSALRDPAIRFTRALNFEASVVRTLLQPVRLLAPLHGSDRALPSQRKLLHPGFRRVGHPSRRWI